MGFGEAPAINYYNIPVAKMIEDIEKHKFMIEKFALTEPERYWHYLHHLIPSNPFLVCALDMAAWDLFGKMKKKPLYEIWQTEWKNIPLTDFTIGIDSIERMIAKMDEKPWPIYKIKLGTGQDIEIVKALKKQTQSVIRVDANAAWTVEEAKEKIPRLTELGVEFVEQPLAKEDLDGMKELYPFSALPLMADESCVSEGDVMKCKDHFHGINIKLTKCSGITPALRMIKQAKQLRLKVMMGCMNESSIGSAAIANFLPQLDYADMDGPLLLSRDLAIGLLYDRGSVRLSGLPGLGVEVNMEVLEEQNNSQP